VNVPRTRPLLLDLFCGRGGWSRAFIKRGWDCVGVDLGEFSRVYPALFLRRDVRSLDFAFLGLFDGIVASPPCEEFARAWMPWLRGDHKPDPEAIALLEWSIDLVARVPCPVVVECSRFATKHVAGAVMSQSWAFWGDVPVLLPHGGKKQQPSNGAERASRRGEVPECFGAWLATLWGNGQEPSSARSAELNLVSI
jgi:hypothetical protein